MYSLLQCYLSGLQSELMPTILPIFEEFHRLIPLAEKCTECGALLHEFEPHVPPFQKASTPPKILTRA
jgi:hypothetical protein